MEPSGITLQISPAKDLIDSEVFGNKSHDNRYVAFSGVNTNFSPKQNCERFTQTLIFIVNRCRMLDAPRRSARRNSGKVRDNFSVGDQVEVSDEDHAKTSCKPKRLDFLFLFLVCLDLAI